MPCVDHGNNVIMCVTVICLAAAELEEQDRLGEGPAISWKDPHDFIEDGEEIYDTADLDDAEHQPQPPQLPSLPQQGYPPPPPLPPSQPAVSLSNHF